MAAGVSVLAHTSSLSSLVKVTERCDRPVHRVAHAPGAVFAVGVAVDETAPACSGSGERADKRLVLIVLEVPDVTLAFDIEDIGQLIGSRGGEGGFARAHDHAQGVLYGGAVCANWGVDAGVPGAD